MKKKIELTDEQKKIKALAKYLEIKPKEIEVNRHDDTIFEAERNEYMVLDESEADARAADYIKETLWAFNASFLSGETGIAQEVFEAIQSNGKCESNNDAIASCIDDMDSFVQSAISADGRGHFLNTYDGDENEQDGFFIYRMN